LLGIQAVTYGSAVLVLRFATLQLLDKSTGLTLAVAGWAGLGVVLCGSSFLLWLYILSRSPVSFALPITVGVTMAVTVVGAYFFLGEKITLLQIVGILVMFLAVLLLNASGAPATTGPKL
jgi:drug/metabolite transporter (DMT)-like permease